MSIKEMWNYLIFQTKGYRQLGAAIVAGAVCGAGISYINSILYARIIDTLLLESIYDSGTLCLDHDISSSCRTAGLPNVQSDI